MIQSVVNKKANGLNGDRKLAISMKLVNVDDDPFFLVRIGLDRSMFNKLGWR